MLITRVSILTGRTHTLDIPVTGEQMRKWEEGTYIQHAAPDLTAAEREFIISGITPDEWAELVVGSDEERC